MKTYNAPSITEKGTVTESTRSNGRGTRDPRNMVLIELEASGTVGFQL
jgi:hypothetical protein